MGVSAHYFMAESFDPIANPVNIYNELIENLEGDTDEWGIRLSFLKDRFILRASRFETRNQNNPTTLGGALNSIMGVFESALLNIVNAERNEWDLFPSESDALLTLDTIPSNRQRTSGTDADLIGAESFDEYYSKLIDMLPPDIQEIYDYRITREDNGQIRVIRNVLDGARAATSDLVSKGLEIEAAGKLTRNWSVSLNISQQETVLSNIGPAAIPLAFEIMDRIKSQGLYNIRFDPFGLEESAIGVEYENVIRQLRIEKGQEGTASQEQREWRANLLTRYDFLEGNFKGFSIGGALRYQDEVAAGYTNIWDEFGNAVPDVENPLTGPEEINGDAFIRYRRQLNGDLNWTVQLHARNLYRKNGDADIPITRNPDGRVGLIRIPNEQQFFLSNTFEF